MSVGSVRLTADGVVGRSGSGIRVHNVVLLAGAGGAGELVLRNGTADTATAYVTEAGTAASKTKTYNFIGGLVFPDGCFYDADSNNAAIVASYELL